MNTTLAPATLPTVPWWRVGVMWLFVGGLGAVVLGSFGLLSTALQHADAVLPQLEAAQRAAPKTPPNTPASPAMQARNHSATPRP